MLAISPLRAATNATTADDEFTLRPPHPEIPPTLWEKHGWLIVAVAIIGLMVVGTFVWFLTRPKPAVVVPPEAQARRALEALYGQPEDGTVLSQASQILRHYIMAAFEMPPGELTTVEFGGVVASHERVGAELATALAEFLRRCDDRKFAVTAGQPPMGAAEGALRLVEQAEARRAQMRGATATRPPGPPPLPK